jgi:hypothetical protein
MVELCFYLSFPRVKYLAVVTVKKVLLTNGILCPLEGLLKPLA